MKMLNNNNKNCQSKITFIRLSVFFLISVLINQSTFAKTKQAPIFANMETVKPVWAANGMVVSVDGMATDIGVEILKRGGNAVDAAVAVGFALAVTYPRAGNIGGGGFMIIHLAKSAENIAIDYREMAPAKAYKDMFLDENGNVTTKSLFHGLASGVPGSVMGMELALKKYGTMSLAEVMQPAIKLAKNGFAVSRDLYLSLKSLKKRLQKWPSSKKIFYKKNGDNYQIGEIFYQKDLAKTLNLIAQKGSAGFYQGAVAKKIAQQIQSAGGVMSTADLKNYHAEIRKPVVGQYRGYEIVSMPPPSSGGVHLVQLLNILENMDITRAGHNSALTIHYMAEAMKFVYADRSKYLGDADFYAVPVSKLIDKKYAKRIFNRILPHQAIPSTEIKPGSELPYESNQTTHYSVVDKWHNAVSTTTTLNFSYGSGLVAEGTGVLLNNEMDDFSAKPGVPNAYGLLGGKANAIEAGKRPLSAMTPTIVLKNNQPFLVTGSPGGSRIITTTLQLIMNVIDHQMNVAEATYASRIHHQWFPDEIRVERSLNEDTIRLLRAMGYKVVVKSAMGATQSIMLTADGLFGASDPRTAQGKAAGY